MKCGECVKSYLVFCPSCGDDMVLCSEDMLNKPLSWWDKDNGCDGKK